MANPDSFESNLDEIADDDVMLKQPSITSLTESADENDIPLEKSSDPVVVPSLREIFHSVLSVEGILIPSIILAAVGYFLGWRYLFSYYVYFGLDTSLFSFSVVEIVASGWRTYFYIAIILIGAFFISASIHSLWPQLISRWSSNRVFVFFYTSLVCGLSFIVYAIYLFFLVPGAQVSLSLYEVSFMGLALLWSAYLIGLHLWFSLKSMSPGKSHKYWFFRIVFPNQWIWLLVIMLGFIGILASATSWNGTQWAKRDSNPTGRLQIATICTTEPMSISGGTTSRKGRWCYKELRFLLDTDGFFFVFRPEEIKDGIPTLYAIPKNMVVEMSLKSWIDQIRHPSKLQEE